MLDTRRDLKTPYIDIPPHIAEQLLKFYEFWEAGQLNNKAVKESERTKEAGKLFNIPANRLVKQWISGKGVFKLPLMMVVMLFMHREWMGFNFLIHEIQDELKPLNDALDYLYPFVDGYVFDHRGYAIPKYDEIAEYCDKFI